MKKELQSKDLRIGNLVEYVGLINSRFRKIGEFKIEPHHFGYLFEIDDDWGLLKPIRLTEEMCDSLGCYYGIGGEPRFFASGLTISVHFKNECVTIELGHGVIFIDHIEYVHELQNLFFALTGEELELKRETP